MSKPVKVIFKKIQKSKTVYESFSYYENEQDFNDRNPTLFFESMTTKTKPPVVKKAS